MRSITKEKLELLRRSEYKELVAEFIELAIDEIYRLLTGRAYARPTPEEKARNLKVREKLLTFRGGYRMAHWFLPTRQKRLGSDTKLQGGGPSAKDDATAS